MVDKYPPNVDIEMNDMVFVICEESSRTIPIRSAEGLCFTKYADLTKIPLQISIMCEIPKIIHTICPYKAHVTSRADGMVNRCRKIISYASISSYPVIFEGVTGKKYASRYRVR